MLDLYEIDSKTLAILYEEDGKTRIVTTEGSILTNLKTKDIIKSSCLFYGSSYEGRISYSKKNINSNIKLPIIIDDVKQIIFFPTKSIRLDSCSWICFNNIDRYIKNGKNTTIIFNSGKLINLDISFNIIDNQITRCIKLEREMKKRREK